MAYHAVCRAIDCSGKRTKRKKYVLIQKNWQQIHCQHRQSRRNRKCTECFLQGEKIRSGSISGIGAIGELTLRFFNPQTKAYEDKTFREQMEISNLTGNISTMDEKTYLHLHITVGRNDYSALAGHLLAATLNGAGEFVVENYGEQVKRVYNPDLGLNIYDFEK